MKTTAEEKPYWRMKMPEQNIDGTWKAHEPTDKTRAEVSALRSFGNTHKEIATYIGITDDTLVKYYSYELDTAVIRANALVAKGLFNKAVSQDDLSAQIFWLKTRARWRTDEAFLLMENNDKLKQELQDLREQLDAKNRKDY